MELTFSLHNALPTLVVELRDGTWHARINLDWESSYEGTVWPEALADDEIKLPNGHFIDWVEARGAAGELGAAAASMDFPESIDLGPIPPRFIADFRGDGDSLMAFDDRKKARDWAGSDDTVSALVPDLVSENDVMESLRASVKS